MILPPFGDNDLLPVGDYAMTLDELRESHLVTGDGNPSENWNRSWRDWLVSSLGVICDQLWRVGITEIFIDGSFVQNKDLPSDIDGYFVCDKQSLLTGELERQLNALDPHKVWTWKHTERRLDPITGKMQLPMWHRYHVEMYPHFPGNFSGICDQYGNDLEFPSAFRRCKLTDEQKGIVRILRSRP